MRHSKHYTTGMSLLAFVCFAFFLGGCSTIYVGDIPFTSVELCSEELASRMHPHSGCLPPTRAENAQSFFLARYRLQLSRTEADRVEDDGVALPDDERNQLPSWIGRAFRVGAEIDNTSIEVPSSGNLDFFWLPGEPQKKIQSEIQIQTDISAILEKNISAGISLSPEVIAEKALESAGVPPVPGLLELLAAQVISARHDKTLSSAATGAYYYVSMSPAMLDGLTTALARCGWRIDAKADKQTAASDLIVSNSAPVALPMGAETVTASRADKDASCLKGPDTQRLVSDEVTALLSGISDATEDRSDVKNAGIVIGMAIVQTKSAGSAFCSRTAIGLIAKGKDIAGPSTCADLKKKLDDFVKKNEAVVATNGATVASLIAPPLQKASLIKALSVEYARGTYKTMDLYPHTSILAIHWLPVRLPKKGN